VPATPTLVSAHPGSADELHRPTPNTDSPADLHQVAWGREKKEPQLARKVLRESYACRRIVTIMFVKKLANKNVRQGPLFLSRATLHYYLAVFFSNHCSFNHIRTAPSKNHHDNSRLSDRDCPDRPNCRT